MWSNCSFSPIGIWIISNLSNVFKYDNFKNTNSSLLLCPIFDKNIWKIYENTNVYKSVMAVLISFQKFILELVTALFFCLGIFFLIMKCPETRWKICEVILTFPKNSPLLN